MTPEFQEIELEITPETAGARLDAALARLMPEQSRSRIKQWIQAGTILLDARPARPSAVVNIGDRILVRIPPERAPGRVEAESIALNIVFEDRDCLVIDKPVGLVVHPGAGNSAHTLQNALLGYDPALERVARAGIIHRLDKDTSGLLVIARSPEAQTSLSRQLLARSVRREYEAVCVGVMTGGGSIDKPIGRHRSDRLRMTIREDGRPAVTHYRVLERFRAHTLTRVQLETGRTHQIRLHLSHMGYPIVGDPVYGGRLGIPKGASAELTAQLRGLRRQALHAACLSFDHPRTKKRKTFSSPLPADLVQLLNALRADLRSSASGGDA
jgi:23S rRNA pseudouridine1911/1915/1917 synthase